MEKFNIPEAPVEKVADLFKHSSLNLTNVSLTGLQNPIDWDSVPNNVYGEQNGVIIIKTEGEVLAVPANSKNRELVLNSDLSNSINGVPNLNNADVWGDEARRNQMESFKKWVDLVSKSDEAERSSLESE